MAGGFTLLEVLVAFLLAVLVIVATLQAASLAASQWAKRRQMAELLELAAAERARLGAELAEGRPLQSLHKDGRLPGGAVWTARLEPELELPSGLKRRRLWRYHFTSGAQQFSFVLFEERPWNP